MIIAHNMAAMNANRIHKNNTNKMAKSTTKLSSGYRINVAADDAAGLAISEKMRSQIRGLSKAAKNAQDGISFVQVADGALNESHAILHRCRELAVQAANDTYVESDREAIQEEIFELMGELDNIAKNTEFNTLKVFTSDGNATVKPVEEVSITVEWSFVDADGNPVAVEESQGVGMDTNYAHTPFAQFIEKAATDAVASLATTYPNLFTTSSDEIKIGLNLANMDGAGGTLASAALSISASSTSATMAYTLNVDKADYDAADFATMTDEEKADLAATIAHEMTHLVMYDTVTDGMLSSRVGSYPKWFVEGMAQTSSGDGGWVSISAASTDAQIENYMSQLSSMPYGAGYLATMYLGYTAGSDSIADTKSRIIDGLNDVFAALTSGKTLDEAIQEHTSYAGLSDFEAGFSGADADSLGFVKDLLAERGAGAGSLLAAGGLSETEAAAFDESTLTSVHGNYAIMSDNTKYMNAFGTGYTFPEKQGGIAGATGNLMLQIGASEGQGVAVQRFDASWEALTNGEAVDVTSHQLASHTIEVMDTALDKVSSIRAYYGAMQNRLEKSISNLETTAENLQASESRIRDLDMADEMVEYSKGNILLQAAQSMMAQANQLPQGVLSLIQQ